MKKKINRGSPLEELVKGSVDYTMQMIRDAFWKQFPDASGQYYIAETFADHVIISGFGDGWPLKADEYYKVNYSKSGQGDPAPTYTFAAKEAWEVVELAYQPQTPLSPSTAMSPPMRESAEFGGKKRKGVRFEERIEAVAVLEEAQEGKPRRVRFEKAMTAEVVNGNNRRYPAEVLRAAVDELGAHLHESAGQGRAIQVLGEAEHPSDKSTRRPNLLETVTKWDEVSFDGQNVQIVGRVLETQKGKDILTLMEGGVMPGVSMRGYGDGKHVKDESGKIKDKKVFEVTELHITGFDLVLEPSFENAAELIESNQSSLEDDMDLLEELKKLLADHPDLFNGLTEAQIEKMGERQMAKLMDSLRTQLGIGPEADVIKALEESVKKAGQFDAIQTQATVNKAIDEACKDLPYGKANAAFVEAVRAANPQDAAAVKSLVDAKRKEYDGLFAHNRLTGMGFNGTISGIAPVLESEMGTPEFAAAAFELTEQINLVEMKPRRDLRKAETRSEVLTVKLLERFDKMYKHQLLAEARLFQEAELTSDLSLPYSVSRAIIEEAYPSLVAANIFDTGIMETSPTRLFFEAFSGETGYTVAVTDEVEAGGAEGTWYALDNKRITPGTVVVTSNPAGTTYVENTDFIIDYAEGKILFLAAGSVGANDVLVDYSYTAIRKGEMAPIERGKLGLSYVDVAASADRLADQISREAVVFSRSQLGYDAVTRTLASLVRQTTRKIDQGMLYMALTAVISVASNSGGAWTEGTTQADYAELVRLIGATKLLPANRFYVPSFILCSLERAEDLSNWDGFKRDGWPNAILNAAGFAGSVKGLPIFASTEFPSTHIVVGNRELVMYRVYQPMQVKGPFPTYDIENSTAKLVAADQYYTEEFNVAVSPVEEKGAYLTIT